MYRLLPRQTFRVKTTDDNAARRFVTVFRQTWKQLPLNVRRAILRWWRQDGVSAEIWNQLGASGSVDTCRVELLERLDTEMEAACHTPEGLQFSLILFREMPDEVAEGIIAHELGHAFLWAIDKGEELSDQRRSDYQRNADAYFGDSEEIEVRRITTLWGFDEAVVNRWIKRRERQKMNTSRRKGK